MSLWEGYEEEEDDYEFDPEDEEDDELMDCGMDRSGQCSMAGSEQCDFECPLMLEIHMREARKEIKEKK